MVSPLRSFKLCFINPDGARVCPLSYTISARRDMSIRSLAASLGVSRIFHLPMNTSYVAAVMTRKTLHLRQPRSFFAAYS